MATEQEQEEGRLDRIYLGVDGTMGDAQDVNHQFLRSNYGAWCRVCGLTEDYRRHMDAPATLLSHPCAVDVTRVVDEPPDIPDQAILVNRAVQNQVGNPDFDWRHAQVAIEMLRAFAQGKGVSGAAIESVLGPAIDLKALEVSASST